MDCGRFSSVGPKRFSKFLNKQKSQKGIKLGSTARKGDNLELVTVTSDEYVAWANFSLKSSPPYWSVVEQNKDYVKKKTSSKDNSDFLSDDEYNDDPHFLEEEKRSSVKKHETKIRPAWKQNVDLKIEPYLLVFHGLRGEAELIRLVFILAGETYEEKNITEEEELAQAVSATPYRSLPVLTRGGEIWGCVPAIVRTLARKFDLFGQSNHEHLVVEAVFERLCQLKRNHSAVVDLLHVEVQSKEKLEWIYHQLRYVILPSALAEWDKLILTSKGPFIVESGMTLADLAIMDFLDQCSVRLPLDDVLGSYDTLTDLLMLVRRNQTIADYLDDRSELEWNL